MQGTLKQHIETQPNLTTNNPTQRNLT